MAFIRHTDIARLSQNNYQGLIAQGYSKNIWSDNILTHLRDTPDVPWLAKSWRHYLSWFYLAEKKLSEPHGIAEIKKWLRHADDNWKELNEKEILMDEPQNDGAWIRPWRQAVIQSSAII